MATLNPNYTQYLNSQTQTPSQTSKGSRILARVTHVVQGPYLLGTNIPDQYYKSPTDLGVITYQILNGNQDRTLDSGGNIPAKPINAALKQLPLEGELVEIVTGPGVDMNESRGQRDYYYTTPYNVWNASHHNAFPDMGDLGEYVSDIQRSYEDVSQTNQSINTGATGSLTMPLGPNFPEKSNIKSLRQFTGDVTMEGRWGNSIRFGSTTAVNGYENYWSATGSAGDPITIIRNGQGRQSDEIAWFPTVENINTDPSSIYLTAGQKIQIDDLSNFSLASLGVLEQIISTRTNTIPIQQQLTSTNTISPMLQDRRISANVLSTSPLIAVPTSEQLASGSTTSIAANGGQNVGL